MQPRVLENEVIEVSESQAGKGGEHIVYKTLDGNDVMKVRRPIVSQWQTEGEDFLIASEEAMEREGVQRLPSVIHLNPTIVIRNGKDSSTPKKNRVIQPNVAQMFPKLTGYDDLTLSWPQLKDPQIQDQIIELCRQSENIFKKDKLGIDPLGFAALGDNLQGLGKTLLEMAFDKLPKSPELIREFIRMHLDAGIPGQMRNILVAEEDRFIEGDAAEPYNKTGDQIQITKKGGIILADTGVHDLRPTTGPSKLMPAIKEAGLANVIRRIPAQQLTSPIHYLMWGAMIELLLHADPSLETRDLPFINSQNFSEQVQRNIARKVSQAMVEMMIPQFEKHEKSQNRF